MVRPIQNNQHFADNNLKWIHLSETNCNSIQILLKFVPWCLINNTSALVQVMAWHQISNRPCSLHKSITVTSWWAWGHLKSLASSLFAQLLVQAQIKENTIWSYASLAFVRGIRQWPVNSPHKRPVTQNMFPFDDVIMNVGLDQWHQMALLGQNPSRSTYITDWILGLR